MLDPPILPSGRQGETAHHLQGFSCRQDHPGQVRRPRLQVGTCACQQVAATVCQAGAEWPRGGHLLAAQPKAPPGKLEGAYGGARSMHLHLKCCGTQNATAPLRTTLPAAIWPSGQRAQRDTWRESSRRGPWVGGDCQREEWGGEGEWLEYGALWWMVC